RQHEGRSEGHGHERSAKGNQGCWRRGGAARFRTHTRRGSRRSWRVRQRQRRTLDARQSPRLSTVTETAMADQQPNNGKTVNPTGNPSGVQKTDDGKTIVTANENPQPEGS